MAGMSTQASQDDAIVIEHVAERQRYELRDGGRLIGHLDYVEPDPEHVDVLHTEVDEAYGGQGLAGRLTEHAVTDIRDRGRRLIPHCPYVQSWLRRHTDFEDVVDWPED